jgi:hypothetical protein
MILFLRLLREMCARISEYERNFRHRGGSYVRSPADWNQTKDNWTSFRGVEFAFPLLVDLGH